MGKIFIENYNQSISASLVRKLSQKPKIVRLNCQAELVEAWQIGSKSHFDRLSV